MKYYDQHVHSSFSFDSRTELADYLPYANDTFVTCEHVDLENSANDFRDSWMDYKAYCAYLQQLQKKTEIQLLKGVEIGWLPAHHERLKHWLQDKQFDIILLSIHQNGFFDYMDEEAKQHDAAELLHGYFQQMLEGVQSDIPANVLSHFDYVNRIQGMEAEQFLTAAIPYLKKIFPVMMQRNMALELNTRSMFQYHQLPLYEAVVKLYMDMGGSLFTMSSDAHKTEAYAFQFDKGRDFLQHHGISTLTVFQGGRPYSISLDQEL